MRRFRSIVLVLALVAVPLAAENGRDLAKATPESVGVSSERLRRLDAGMQRFVDEGRLAGVTTLLARRGKIVNANAYGKKDVSTPDPIQRDSIFRIYSMTKPITGVAMMMLYEEGKWRLDDPVSRYIPEFSKLQVYIGENADGTMKLEDARRSMTMRELMTHSAGLGLRAEPDEPGRSHDHQGADPQSGRPAADDDRQAREGAAAGAARDALVLQHRRRRAGLSGREALGAAVRRLPADAPVRSARHEGHGVLRAEDRSWRVWRGSTPMDRTASWRRRPTTPTTSTVPPAGPVGRRRPLLDRATTTCASRRCC